MNKLLILLPSLLLLTALAVTSAIGGMLEPSEITVSFSIFLTMLNAGIYLSFVLGEETDVWSLLFHIPRASVGKYGVVNTNE